LRRTDSATTERTPPGPTSRASVAMTWTNEKDGEIAHLTILARTANPPGIVRHQQFAIDRLNLDCEEKSTRQSLARANHVANRSADFSRLANPLSDSE